MNNKYKLAVLYGKVHCINNKICELIEQKNKTIEEIGYLETEINKPTNLIIKTIDDETKIEETKIISITKVLGVGSGWEPEINVNDIYEE